jgi:hypothetical protein
LAAQLQGLAQGGTALLESHIQGVRLYLRDFAELNQLIEGQETSDRMIKWSTLDFLSDFNGTPHFTGFTLTDLYNRQLQSLSVRGTVITILESLILTYNRNHLPFSDGGISVSINDKAGFLMGLHGMFKSGYEQQKRQVKIALNIEGMLLDGGTPGVHSDYMYLGGQYGSY